ncbi:unnamed protein product [Acanthoscelides obtectus]|uniref:Uncharacterized protein n=1 Tax=Acanthoscelides obtectus TaxID=200917 RepID=A0A9P0NWI0_ACAOB|nr:unnamed protein product [Acanthoscelides obtectus]CAK1673775.1 hypothetical protein AOBTE_LOCUS29434 [Acanthoscelides obtectus]
MPSSASDYSRVCSISPADTGCSLESPAPEVTTGTCCGEQHDAHSSEEELEVINGKESSLHRTLPNKGCKGTGVGRGGGRPLRAASVGLAEKRKWSQVVEAYGGRRYTPENEENMSHYGNLSPSSPCLPYLKCYGEDGVYLEHSGSSDDEVHLLTTTVTPTSSASATPVRFRTSPPLSAVKPSAASRGKGRTASPPPAKLAHLEASPRKRTRRHHMSLAEGEIEQQQRPYLDFEKMQQLKSRSSNTIGSGGGVTAWRHTGDHAGELSVFCW